jgi:hypothetical protein
MMSSRGAVLRRYSFAVLACIVVVSAGPAGAQLVPQRQSAACEFSEKYVVKELLKKIVRMDNGWVNRYANGTGVLHGVATGPNGERHSITLTPK